MWFISTVIFADVFGWGPMETYLLKLSKYYLVQSEYLMLKKEKKENYRFPHTKNSG